MQSDLVTYEIDGPVAVLTLNRPDKRNAINDGLIYALEAAIRRAAKEARVGIVHGNGKHFSAGLDLAEHLERSPLEGLYHSRMWHRIFEEMERGQIPFIAALHGAVVGGGLELAASASLRVADETTYFGLPEGQRGIFVGGGGSVRIARLLGVAQMTDMMLTGRTFNAADGERFGLVNYVVPAGGALAKAKELAAKIATNAPMSNFAVTNALSRIQDLSHDDGLFFEALIAAMMSTSPEAAVRLKAFLEGRAGRVTAPKE
jgi:enoyl-CoA hydratase/carnithine racemase